MKKKIEHERAMFLLNEIDDMYSIDHYQFDDLKDYITQQIELEKSLWKQYKDRTIPYSEYMKGDHDYIHNSLFVLSMNERDEIIKKQYELLSLYKKQLIEMFIEFDELGIEPSIPTEEDGKEINNRWRNHFLLLAKKRDSNF